MNSKYIDICNVYIRHKLNDKASQSISHNNQCINYQFITNKFKKMCFQNFIPWKF